MTIQALASAAVIVPTAMALPSGRVRADHAGLLVPPVAEFASRPLALGVVALLSLVCAAAAERSRAPRERRRCCKHVARRGAVVELALSVSRTVGAIGRVLWGFIADRGVAAARLLMVLRFACSRACCASTREPAGTG